jgi:hypothetical protein
VATRSARSRLGRRARRERRVRRRGRSRAAPRPAPVGTSGRRPACRSRASSQARRASAVSSFSGRAAPAGDQVGVDRQHAELGLDQPLDQQAVAGLDDHPDLGRVRLQGGDVGHQRRHGGWGVLDRRTCMTPGRAVPGPPGGTPRPSRSQQPALRLLCSSSIRTKARRRADDQSSGDDTLVGVGPPGPAPWDAVSRQSSRDKQRKRSHGATHDQGG